MSRHAKSIALCTARMMVLCAEVVYTTRFWPVTPWIITSAALAYGIAGILIVRRCRAVDRTEQREAA